MKKLLAVLSLPLVLGACSTSHINADGTTDNPIFPKVNKTTFSKSAGIFPTQAALAELKPNMTKDQVYNLFHEPQNGEGFGAQEWDYQMHFHTPGKGIDGVTICQLKLTMKKGIVKGIYWNPVAPADAVCPVIKEVKPEVVREVIIREVVQTPAQIRQ